MPIILYAYGLVKHIITCLKHSQMNQDLVHHAAKVLCVYTPALYFVLKILVFQRMGLGLAF